MSNNQVWGRLDQACALAKTGNMEQIGLAGNNITSSIPACLIGLKSLVELHLDNNALTGTIPQIPNSKSSKLMYLTAANQVNLAARLPRPCMACAVSSHSGLPSPSVILLRALPDWMLLQTAQGGGLNGSLPGSISELTHLSVLDFSGNQLTGDLPGLPANILTVQLSSNSLSNNGMTEAMPPSYGAKFSCGDSTVPSCVVEVSDRNILLACALWADVCIRRQPGLSVCALPPEQPADWIHP